LFDQSISYPNSTYNILSSPSSEGLNENGGQECAFGIWIHVNIFTKNGIASKEVDIEYGNRKMARNAKTNMR
jgi:hypothetical protein